MSAPVQGGYIFNMKQALAALAALAIASPAGAVVIVEETWRANGGSDQDWSKGFEAHDALAAQPQFRAMVAFAQDERDYGVASGVWIGNDEEGHAFILTAGHVVTDGVTPDRVRIRTSAGAELHCLEFFVHPGWDNKVASTGGMDFAILKLDRAITDSGPPPVLYSGRHERGRRAVLVGYGTHGVAPFGHGYRFGPNHGEVMTAAENVIDRISPMQANYEANRWGDSLVIDLDQPNGSGKNRTGDVDPISPLEGILAPGDSGGSLWVNFNGRWRIVGVNSSGDPGAAYQDLSNFARVTTQKAWIRSVFPGARFEGDKTE